MKQHLRRGAVLTALALGMAPSVAHAAVTITSGPEGATNQTTVTFAFESSISAEELECRLDDAEFGLCSDGEAVLEELAEGDYTFDVRDSEDTVQQAFTVDTTAPTAVVVTGGPGAFTNATSATFNFTQEEGLAPDCELDAVAIPCATGNDFPLGAEGQHALTVLVRDAAGNSSPSAAFVYTVDRTKPVARFTAGAEGITNRNVQKYEYTSTDATAVEFGCKLDDKVFPTGECTSGEEVTFGEDGDHSFSITPRDAAGNVGDTVERKITLDRRKPTVDIPGFPAADAAGTISIPIVSNEAGATFRCSLDGSPLVACASPAVFRGLPAGSRHVFKADAIDRAGNESARFIEYTFSVPAPPAPAPAPPAALPGPGFEFFLLKTAKLKTVASKGLKQKIELQVASRVTAKLTVTRAVARKLGLGRTTTLATLTKTAPKGVSTLTIKLSSKAKKALKKQRKAVKAKIGLVAVANGETETASQAVTLKP